MWSKWFNQNDLEQYVDVPTFERYKNSLDLVFTPKNQDVKNMQVTGSIFGPFFDHLTLLFGLQLGYETTEQPRTQRNHTQETWKNYRKDLIKRKIYENAELLQRDYTAEDCIDDFLTKTIKDAYETATPEIIVNPPPVEGYLQQGTVQIIRKSKRSYHNLKWASVNGKWSKERLEKAKAELKFIKKSVSFMMRRDRIVNEIRKLEISEKKGENFYKYMKNNTKKTTSTFPVRDKDRVLQTENKNIAETFNEYLGETLQPGEPVDVEWETEHYASTPKGFLRLFKPSVHPEGPSETLNQVYISPEAVKQQIKLAKKDAAPGPDGLPINVFAEAEDILKEPLAMLYNLVSQTGNIPKSWKTTRVVMLHKKKSKDDVKNYRPLSMSNHTGKIWERLVNSALKAHLEEHSLFDPNQYGFRNGMGTQTNLLQMWELIIDKLEKEGALVEFWSFDLTKAFDLLDHNKVLNLLKKAGVTGRFGKCIQNWLCGRNQYVEVEKTKSSTVPVGKSCVQGSVLEPTLWLVYMQSLMDELKKNGVNYYGYADVIAIIKTIKTLKDKEEFEKILKILENWAVKYGMNWSPLRTQRLVLKYKGCKEPHSPYEIFFEGQSIIPLESTAESLGLLIGKNCIFGAQIKRITDRIKSITCSVRRNFANRSPEILVKIYNTYVQSRLDYCSQVWYPGKESLIRPIENAVKTFWKLGSSGVPPKDFMLPSLRLIFTDLVLFHKIVHEKSVIKFEEKFQVKITNKT